MRAVMIKNKICSTIEEFYSMNVPKIRYSQTKQPIPFVCDFYQEFLVDGKRLPDKEVVEEWHDLLVWYINQPDATFFVRKYEGGKKNGQWDNRRGAVVRFDDGFEIVYASNFLAHDIFLMAYHGFVPDQNDFMTAVKNRKLHITSGTKVEKEIRTYTLANKGLSYCYLAHIMDVNGNYLRRDGSYRKLSATEEGTVFPHGTAANWKSSSDGIWHVNYALSCEEKDLVKAHCIRFLDPMNYYLTPLTNQSSHTVKGLKKNIGEYKNLTYFIAQKYKHIFANRFDQLIREGKYLEKAPSGYTGKETINLEYSSKKNSAKGLSSPSVTTRKGKVSAGQKTGSTLPRGNNEFSDFEGYAAQNGVSTPSYYSSLIRSVTKEWNLRSVSDLEDKLEALLAACKQKMEDAKIAKDKSCAKKYGNFRSALRKYRDYLKQKQDAMGSAAVFLKTPEASVRNAPYIRYKKGWSSFVPAREHVTGYCIDNDTITVFYGAGFTDSKQVCKKISDQDRKELVEILELAKKNGLFEKSDSQIMTQHGPVSSYDYQYGNRSGANCKGLFVDHKTAEGLKTRYFDFINKLIK